MKSSIFSLFALIAMLCAPCLTLAQDEAESEVSKRSIGLSASLQGNQAGILLPIWLGDNFVLAPSLSFVYAQDQGTEPYFWAFAPLLF